MTPEPRNTLFLRLEGALQSWGYHGSKFVVRRTAEAPTKSGVAGLLCATLGVGRLEAADEWIPKLQDVHMGVRMDRPGKVWSDYQTIGAQQKIKKAERKVGGPVQSKPGPILSRRQYLSDAAFLVVLQGEESVIDMLHQAIGKPRWPPYLGRKSCPPSMPLLIREPAYYGSLVEALSAPPWLARSTGDKPHAVALGCILDWIPERAGETIPQGAEVWYDAPQSFEPATHGPRVVVRTQVKPNQEATFDWRLVQSSKVPDPPRIRANYNNTQYKKVRLARLAHDNDLCAFCKAVGTTVQHIHYRTAGGGERLEDLRTLCRICHDAVTMLEYGAGMTVDRINPEDPAWRQRIQEKRQGIIRHRSLKRRFGREKAAKGHIDEELDQDTQEPRGE